MNRLIIVATVSLALAAVLAADFGDQNQPAMPFVPATYQASLGQAHGINLISFTKTAAPEPELPVMRAEEAAIRWQKLESLIACAANDSCPFPNDDSRAAHFHVRDELLREGQWFLEHHSMDPEMQVKSLAAATRLLAYPEEQVQGMAVRWISRLPVDGKTVAHFAENLTDVVDPELTEAMLRELARHMGGPDEKAALDLVEEILFEGSIFASREVARSVSLVITDSNRGRISRWLEELPPKSAKARLLRESLEAR